MDSREFKNIIYQGLAKLFKGLANPHRLEIIEMLAQGEKNVEQIASETGLSIANASQHLQVMKNNNIVKTRKKGHYHYYQLVSDDFLAIYQQITKFAVSEIAELEKTMKRQREEHQASSAVCLDELTDMMAENNVLLLDVRPPAEYELGHITGAINIPAQEIEKRLEDLPEDTEIIAYCRGPFCVLADDVVKTLKEKGYNVRRLDKGYPEWKTMKLTT
ncbi:MAG: ArsR/SmtB family transcription factor [Marinilabiliaceae bacterium]